MSRMSRGTAGVMAMLTIAVAILGARVIALLNAPQSVAENQAEKVCVAEKTK